LYPPFVNHQFFTAQPPDKSETAKLFFSKKRQPAFCYSKFLHNRLISRSLYPVHKLFSSLYHTPSPLSIRFHENPG